MSSAAGSSGEGTDAGAEAVSVPEAGKRAVAVYYRSLGALRLSASVDDGDEVTKSLPKCDGIAHAEIGTMEFPAGACVLRLKIENAAAASLFAIEIR